MALVKRSINPSEPRTPRLSDSWVISTELQVNGRHVVPGTELKITGERGRFRFVKHVLNGDIEWIDVWGGRNGAEQMRSFRPSAIKVVHYKNQTDKNLAKAYKEKKKILKAS